MSDALMAIFGGAFLAAFIVIPAGAADTSSGGHKEPLTWKRWKREAATTLWALNPVTALSDIAMGYEDVFGGVIRVMAGVVAAAALLTSVALMGWGILQLFTL